MTKPPSKWKPTSKEMGQLARIYKPIEEMVFLNNGAVMIRRK